MMKEKLQTGDRIEVYRNLHKDCFSIRKNGLVVGYIYDEDDKLNMKDVKFVVQPAGRAKVLRERRKNVHAFLRGIYTAPMESVDAWQYRASYNPYKMDSFFTTFGGSDTPIHSAKRVTLSRGKVFVNS
jgi:hypothetical protein